MTEQTDSSTFSNGHNFYNDNGVKYTDGIPQQPPPSTFTHSDRSDVEKAARYPRGEKRGMPLMFVVFAALFSVLLTNMALILYHHYVGNNRLPTASSIVENVKSWVRLRESSLLAKFKHAAVISDNGLCSEIGRSTLLRGGNAMDATIATSICVGALNLHSSGIGGGFLLVYYNRFYGKCFTVDARETAPFATNKDTFVNNPKDAFIGYKSIAVPGEVHGLWTAYKRFGSGRVNWFNLINPTIFYLTNGYPVTKLMETNLEMRRMDILAEPSMSSLFVNKATGELYKEGELLKNPQLAETLKKLASHSDPIQFFYKSEFAKEISNEIITKGGYITPEDLDKYKAIVDDQPLENSHFNNYSDDSLVMCGPKTPSGFTVTQLIISIMSRLFPSNKYGNDTSVPYSSTDYYHKFIEAQKFGYALRAKLGDFNYNAKSNQLMNEMLKPDFVDRIVEKIEDKVLDEVGNYALDNEIFDQAGKHGTSQITIIDGDGNAVSMTASINNVFGSLRRSEKTGIIWNDQMDDFGVPGAKNFYGFEAHESNYVAPGKRPMSSMSPLIVYDKRTKDVRFAIGASGGSKIISAVSQVFLHTINFHQCVKEAIDMPRIHNQFMPFQTEYEDGFSSVILEELRERGQNITQMHFPFANVHAILRNKEDNVLNANNDYRRRVYTYPTGY